MDEVTPSPQEGDTNNTLSADKGSASANDGEDPDERGRVPVNSGKGAENDGTRIEDGRKDEDDEDGSRMDLLADLREEQRARRKGGGRSASALMGEGRRKVEKEVLVIKGQGQDRKDRKRQPSLL